MQQEDSKVEQEQQVAVASESKPKKRERKAAEKKTKAIRKSKAKQDSDGGSSKVAQQAVTSVPEQQPIQAPVTANESVKQDARKPTGLVVPQLSKMSQKTFNTHVDQRIKQQMQKLFRWQMLTAPQPSKELLNRQVQEARRKAAQTKTKTYTGGSVTQVAQATPKQQSKAKPQPQPEQVDTSGAAGGNVAEEGEQMEQHEDAPVAEQ